jgi:hypothetical protein
VAKVADGARAKEALGTLEHQLMFLQLVEDRRGGGVLTKMSYKSICHHRRLSTNRCKKGRRTSFINAWNVAGAFVRPNGMTRNSNNPWCVALMLEFSLLRVGVAIGPNRDGLCARQQPYTMTVLSWWRKATGLSEELVVLLQQVLHDVRGYTGRHDRQGGWVMRPLTTGCDGRHVRTPWCTDGSPIALGLTTPATGLLVPCQRSPVPSRSK